MFDIFVKYELASRVTFLDMFIYIHIRIILEMLEDCPMLLNNHITRKNVNEISARYRVVKSGFLCYIS